MSIEEFNESALVYDKLITAYYLETLRIYKNKGILFKLKAKAPVYKDVLKDETWCAIQLVLNHWLQWVIHQNKITADEMLSQIKRASNTLYPLTSGLTPQDLVAALQIILDSAETKSIPINRSKVLSKTDESWFVTTR